MARPPARSGKEIISKMEEERFSLIAGFATGENEKKLVAAREVAEWRTSFAATGFFSFHSAAEPVHRLSKMELYSTA